MAISVKTKPKRGIRNKNKKKREIKKKEDICIFLFSEYFSQHVFRRLRSKIVIVQTMRIHKIVKDVDLVSKLQSNFNSALIMALQVRTVRSCKTSIKRTITYMKQRLSLKFIKIKKIKKEKKRFQKGTPRDGISHFCSNHGTSPQRLSIMVSRPKPKTKSIVISNHGRKK